jgi:adenosylcobinamide kinase / adenosylcobinamide-phosphate guanylyltransferase
VLGGARSGKSRHAEALIQAHAPPWTFIATAEALDAEMTERIALHRARRDERWLTLEAPRELPSALDGAPATAPALVDCLTLWLSNLLLAEREIEPAVRSLEAALADRAAPTILVSNEVGWGVVPSTPLGRRFRDAQGWLNQRIAALSARVDMVVAGLPVRLK